MKKTFHSIHFFTTLLQICCILSIVLQDTVDLFSRVVIHIFPTHEIFCFVPGFLFLLFLFLLLSFRTELLQNFNFVEMPQSNLLLLFIYESLSLFNNWSLYNISNISFGQRVLLHILNYNWKYLCYHYFWQNLITFFTVIMKCLSYNKVNFSSYYIIVLKLIL